MIGFKLFGKKKKEKLQSESRMQLRRADRFDSDGPNMQIKSSDNYLIDVSGYSWDSVVGMDDVKEELQEIVALLRPDKATRQAIEHWGIEHPKGMLMYGPPGCGKTFIAKCLASECNASFYLINGPAIMTKWIGESAKNMREIFKAARNNKPSIIFIDEIDAVSTSRDLVSSESMREVVTTLLTQLDGLDELSGVFTIGATNNPDLIDPALLRPGRLDKGVFVSLPSDDMRKELLVREFSNRPVDSNIDFDELANITMNYSAADIVAMADRAAKIAWRRNKYKPTGRITLDDIYKAHTKTGSSVSSDKLVGYQRWAAYAFS